MGDSAETWAHDLRAAVQAVAGERWTAELNSRWAQIEARPVVGVALYGPYDAGKSTLLKRLLVAGGAEIPSWLGISARKETFQPREIRCGGLMFTDTPGLNTGEIRHDEMADAALLHNDAALIVMAPSLLTAGREHVLSVVGGRYFNEAAAVPHPPGALIPVMTQTDTLGPRPGRDTAEFEAALDAKRDELRGMLAPHTALGAVPEPHLISADPFQYTAGLDAPAPDLYTGNEAWDGIAGLRAALAALAARTAELRTGTLVRFWCKAGELAHGQVIEELRRMRDAAAASERERAHLELLERELTALRETAEAELRRRLRRTLQDLAAATAAPSRGEAELAARGERRVRAALDAWHRDRERELAALLERAKVRATADLARPGAVDLREYLNDLLTVARAAPPQPPPSMPETFVLLHLFRSLDDAVRSGVRLSFDRLYGRAGREAAATVAEYAGEVGAVRVPEHGGDGPSGVLHEGLHDGRWDGGSPSVTGDGDTDQDAFDGTGQDLSEPEIGWETADRHAGTSRDTDLEDAIADMGSAMVEFAVVASLWFREAEARKREQQRQAELDAAIERLSTRIADKAVEAWKARVEAARAALGRLHPPAQLHEAQTTRVRELEEAERSLSELLSSPPR
ncbi:hypothetical protein GCM10010182_52910 [Actinomadura cremea]|nr:hypothetical protein GCM10010182_52910 [Actinomadura cremea]